MQQTLPTASTEFHMAASSTFKTILEQRLVNYATFTQTFLQSILNSLDSRDPIVAHAWLETLLDVIELLPVDVIRLEILPISINKGQLSQPIHSRITCCKLVGKICTRFDAVLIKKEVLPTVHSLCQDVNNEVRACICSQLRYVAEGLGAESVRSELLPSLVELASDEESNVRRAAVQTIVHLLPQFPQDVIKAAIAPLIRKLCESALKSDDNVICIIAQEFGRLAMGLENSLTAVEKSWIIKYFQQLAQMGVPSMKKEKPKQDFSFTSNNPTVNERYVECRRHCAFNIPAMFLFLNTATEDVSVLLPTFNDLAGDTYYMVRRTIACGIHEVAKALGQDLGLINADLIKLLKDDAEEVLQGLVPHLATTLELLVQSQVIGTDQIDSTVMELGRSLLKCESEIARTNNWRLSELMFSQLEILPKCFPSDFIYTYFVPVALNRAANARPIPIRLAAARTLLIYLRYNLKSTQRVELRNKMYMDLAHSKSCYVRMIFIRMMIEALVIFSSTYFKEHFYNVLLALTEDPVPNVRLKVVQQLPVLKSLLRLPSDKKLLNTLEGNVRSLMNNEKDRDVVAMLTNVIHKLDGIDVKHEGQTVTKFTKQENEDSRKLEEEKKLGAINLGKPTGTTIAHLTGNSSTGSHIKKQTGATSKLSNSARVSVGEILSTKTARQNNSLNIVDSASKPLVQQPAAKGSRQSVGPMGMNDSQSKTTNIKQGQTASRQITDISKASTSSNNLTSSWARLASNSMLLTHPWEKIGHSNSNYSLSSMSTVSEASCHDYAGQKVQCDCCDLAEHIFQNRLGMPSTTEQEYACCACASSAYECSRASSNTWPQKHDHSPTPDFTRSFLLTHLKKDRHEFLQNFLLTREGFGNKAPGLAAIRAMTDAISDRDDYTAHYNSCWAFSSMPEIPVTLLDDEFLVDAGIRIPAQLSSSQSTSKIPNLQDIIYRNRREGSVDRSRRNSVNFEKLKTQRHSAEYEDSLKPRSSCMDQHVKSNRNSMDYEDTLRSSRSFKGMQEEQHYPKEDTKTKRYSGSQARTRFGYEPSPGRVFDDKSRRNSLILDKDKAKAAQGKPTLDRTKRHSGNFWKLPEPKDSKQKFKRHSVEVTDYNPVERNNRTLRRFSTLDVNHNQGSSKIPLRNCIITGSRTAPVTRASSPIRSVQQFSFSRDTREDIQTSSRDARFLSRFSSSDEEVDKLCQKFINCQAARCSRASSPRSRDSRLPVRLQRKKL
ncbi:serine/threonine-protein phosphatase 4 regulatory subunit 4 isoform X2 [Cephus cinctus]|nr:serine/threonine-protein phosphatase 4 regulatory subunit 4 isoform X2 [Cephus cinctus]XP_024945737.1 serine/threonine-protein phosphatase 4 regulatory subunit 4 isoform X2 [Cephus cinctus]XP_024945738.1 serine/threonine-protein phosphatase 4 regulatory subunit 4 isoform X2 [Cephus cinctus]